MKVVIISVNHVSYKNQTKRKLKNTNEKRNKKACNTYHTKNIGKELFMKAKLPKLPSTALFETSLILQTSRLQLLPVLTLPTLFFQSDCSLCRGKRVLDACFVCHEACQAKLILFVLRKAHNLDGKRIWGGNRKIISKGESVIVFLNPVGYYNSLNLFKVDNLANTCA